MTLDPRIERNLPVILAEIGSGPAPDYTGAVLERISHVRQRPAWAFRERWLPARLAAGRDRLGPVPLRLVVLVVLLVIVLVVTAILSGVGRRRSLPPPFGPAANGAIVYEVGGDIFTGDPVAGTSQAIIPGPTYDFGPGYSPDGSTIAFLRRVDAASAGRTNIVLQPDGGPLRVITAVPLAAEPAWWSWTPDSRSIVVMMGGSDNTTYEVLDASGSGPPRVVTPPVPVDPPMAFQPPTGGRVVVRGHVGLEIGLYTMDIDGSRMTTVVEPAISLNDQIDLVYPAWSPDGTRIVFQRATTDGSTTGLFVMNADGSDARQIDAPAGAAAAGWAFWSPDGTRIAFQWSSGVRDSNNYFLYRWAVDRVAEGTAVSTGPVLGYDTLATWSPDGREILVLNTVASHPGLILDPDGGASRTVPWSAVGGDWGRIAP